MFFYGTLFIVALLISLIIYHEYKNEKSYKKERERKYHQAIRQNESKSTTKISSPSIRIKPVTSSPQFNYPPFTHARLIAMGLSQEDAKEFVKELISQIEANIPFIDEAMKIPDFNQMERLTHSLKGSATNLGNGGISDLLVDYNTYLKDGRDLSAAQTYFAHLKYCLKILKEQYA
ncbi:MAG: Hpt domain-containing protein [Sulfurovum sp.]|nr:Hpt domain-containing protein [Sulfurovum sp.]